MAIRRRSFLKALGGSLAALFGGALSWIGCALPGRFRLNPAERDAIEAAAARILPSEDGSGADEAGVIEYIERALATSYHRALREPFRRGGSILNGLAQKNWNRPFAQLEPEDQDSVLSYVETGRADTAEFPASRFFHRLVMLTLEGFLGDPIHGGNRDDAGWKFIGYTPGGPRPGACRDDSECGR
jgi:gluconate 2-dehydrogenase gamma chain